MMETRPIYNKKDRISKLHDSLIHHILAFIDMKYAVQTSVLSRRWRYIWTSLPTLNFDSELYYCEETGNYNDFIDFVDMVLFLRDGSNIQRFHIDWICTLTYAASDNIIRRLNNVWILFAVRHNVQELSIKGVCYEGFVIPPSLTICKTLTKLELNLYDEYVGPIDVVLPSSMSLPRLKSLRLELLKFQDEKLTNMLFSSCPAMESLIITGGDFRNMNLNISSLKLKHLKVCFLGDGSIGMVKLYAPNLTSFSCADMLSTVVVNEELYQHVMEMLRALHNVKVLTLSPWSIEVVSRAHKLIDNSSPQFSNLHRMTLITWLTRDCTDAIIYLLKISPNIEYISLQIEKKNLQQPPMYLYIDEIKLNSENTQVDNWGAGLSLSPFMLYNLKFVELQGFLGCVNELKFLEILLKYAMVLEKVVLSGSSSKKDSSKKERRMMIFRDKLLSFPRASASVTILCKFKKY